MRSVVATSAASGACLTGVIVAEALGVENGLGGIAKIIGVAAAAVCGAMAWWLYRQVQAERRYDAELDAELEECGSSRVVTLGSPARCVEGAGPRPALLSATGGRSRVLVVGGTLALVLIAVAAIRPNISFANTDHDPAIEPSGSNSGDLILRYRPPGTTTEFPNGCTLNYVEGGVVFERCRPGTLADLLGGIPDDS